MASTADYLGAGASILGGLGGLFGGGSNKELQNIINALYATQIDAYGNQSGYDKQRGVWFNILSAAEEQLANASKAEQLQRLTTDASQERADRQGNARERGIERNLAQGLRAQYQYNQQNPRDVLAEAQSITRNNRSNEVSDAYRQIAQQAGVNAARTGNAGYAESLSELARSLSNANLTARGDGQDEALQLAAALEATRPGTDLSDYDLLQTRASNYDVVNPDFEGYDPNAQLIAQQASRMGQLSNIAGFAAQQGGSNSGLGSFLTGLGGLFNAGRGVANLFGGSSGTNNAAPTVGGLAKNTANKR